MSVLMLSGGAYAASAQSAHTDGVTSGGAGNVQLRSDPRVNTLTCRNGHIQIGYTGQRITESDWFGLYSNEPNPGNWSDGLVNQDWQWARNSDRYLTDQSAGRFTAVYWTYDDETAQYEIVSTERLQYIDCEG